MGCSRQPSWNSSRIQVKVLCVKTPSAIFAVAVVIAFISLNASLAVAQNTPMSHEQCIKAIPGDWGPNFGDEWHRNESLYWGCRLGVPAETVATWQKAAEEFGMAQDIIPVTVKGKDLVILEEMDGSAHCFKVKVLKRVGAVWSLAWELPSAPDSMDYCSLACPSLRVLISSNVLTVSSPTTSNPSEDMSETCKSVSWHNERFRWNGSSFERMGHSDKPAKDRKTIR
jgi:hypothetical protein